ncbi:MAG: AMP-binding protein [Rhodospirillales bacterium]|nr:AMP-binding protein [Rhodospirillales bacterium]
MITRTSLRMGEGFRDLAQIAAIETMTLAARDLPATNYEALRRTAERAPDRPALTFLADASDLDGAVTLDYRALFARVTALANELVRCGARRQEPVALLLPNCLDYLPVFIAAELVGIAFPVNPLLAPHQLASLFARAGVRFVVTVPMLLDAALQTGAQVLLIEGEDSSAATLDAGGSDQIAFEAAPHGNASLFATGGTTGEPKLAPHTHANESFMAWAIGEAIGLTEHDVLLCGLPLFHVNGITVTGLSPFACGAHVVLLGAQGYRDAQMRAGFWRIVERFGASLFSAVPTVLDALLAVPVDGADTSSLRAVVCGAAPLSADLFTRFERAFGVRLLEGYGLTEGTCASIVNPLQGERRVGSVGLRLPYQQLRCVELRDGAIVRDCEIGEVGALILKGPNVFPGYLGQERTGRVGDGWFDTGDLARLDADGYVWLAGRAKDLIIRGGHNIDPSLTEESLLPHPQVRLVAAVGMPDKRLGEVPVAFVVPHAGTAPDPASLVAFARERSGERAAAPVDVFLRDELPLTPVGKLFKPVLRLEACRIAFERALAAAGCDDIRVLARLDARVGVLVELAGVAAPTRPQVAACLAGFTVAWEIHDETIAGSGEGQSA